MQLIIHFLEQFHSDYLFGGGGQSLDQINNPGNTKGNHITPDRPAVFKRFNYRFKA